MSQGWSAEGEELGSGGMAGSRTCSWEVGARTRVLGSGDCLGLGWCHVEAPTTWHSHSEPAQFAGADVGSSVSWCLAILVWPV